MRPEWLLGPSCGSASTHDGAAFVPSAHLTWALKRRLWKLRWVLRTIFLISLQSAGLAVAQRAPASPDHPWHGLGEARIEADARNFTEPGLSFDQEKTYSLPELIDLAESHNPEARVAWERARARANLSNAQAVQQAAEERLNHGLATLPDVLEARSATAQAEYELQAVLGAEEIAHGNLATALGTIPQTAIRVQPLRELTIPSTIDDTVNSAMDRALAQRPDLLQRVADVQAAKARVKEARAAYYPSLNFTASPTAQSLYGLQQQFPWGHTAGRAVEYAFKCE